jgi:hypothetical protein
MNNIDKFISETKCNENDAYNFFESHKEIISVNELITLYNDNRKECFICLDKKDDLIMFIPCEHKIICKKCAQDLISKYNECLHTNIDKCPICRKKWCVISENVPFVPPQPVSTNEQNNISIHEILIIGQLFSIEHENRQVCKFYKKGFCVRGNDCIYSHPAQYENIQRQPLSNEYCKHYRQRQSCIYGNNCFFVHQTPPLF